MGRASERIGCGMRLIESGYEEGGKDGGKRRRLGADSVNGTEGGYKLS